MGFGGGMGLEEEVGRIAVKTRGREAGLKCVIVDLDQEDGFVVVTGPKDVSGVRRRRVNVLHLAFTPHKVRIRRGATDEEVKKALEEAGLLDYVRSKVRVEAR
jgi:large subunit ribosomal protein L14e